MHSLRLKLIVTFLVISVTGTLFTTLIVRVSTERAFNNLLREQELAAFANEVRAYYESNGSWQGVDPVMRSLVTPIMPGDPPQRPPPFALANENGLVILASGAFPKDSIVPPNTLTGGIPLVVDGQQVGTVLVDKQEPPPRTPAEQAFETQTNRALLMGALGAARVEWLTWVRAIAWFFAGLAALASLFVIAAALAGYS